MWGKVEREFGNLIVSLARNVRTGDRAKDRHRPSAARAGETEDGDLSNFRIESKSQYLGNCNSQSAQLLPGGSGVWVKIVSPAQVFDPACLVAQGYFGHPAPIVGLFEHRFIDSG